MKTPSSREASKNLELSELSELLRRGSRRITGPRECILQLLNSLHRPATIKQIHESLGDRFCDLATVYRAVHMLESMGLVKRFDFGDGIRRFELVRPGTDCHYHLLICTLCQAVVKLDDCLAHDWEERVAAQSGYAGVTHRLEFFGVCPACCHPKPPKTSPGQKKSHTTCGSS